MKEVAPHKHFEDNNIDNHLFNNNIDFYEDIEVTKEEDDLLDVNVKALVSHDKEVAEVNLCKENDMV